MSQCTKSSVDPGGWSQHVAEPVDDVERDERERKQFARQPVDVVGASLLHGHEATLQPETQLVHRFGDGRKQLRRRRR